MEKKINYNYQRGGKGYGVKRNFQQYFSGGGGNGVPGENHWPDPSLSHWQTLSDHVVSNTPHHEQNSELTLLVVIGTDCTDNGLSNYHTITIMTVPN